MKDQTLAADAITDAQIRELRQKLFKGPADARALHGLVACHDALGRSHRRSKARAHCANLINELANANDLHADR